MKPQEEQAVEPERAFAPDPVLLAAEGCAREALAEGTPPRTVGAGLGHVVEGEHALTLLFDCLLPGYPGWAWAATLVRVDGDAEATVAETALIPGDRALLAPDWVPWADRLAEYRAAQAAERAAGGGDDSDEADGSDDDDEDDDEYGADDSDDDLEIEVDEDGSDEEPPERDDETGRGGDAGGE